jgi:hypothetical protein
MARIAATGPMKATAARQIRRTAALLDHDHPEMIAGDHLRDAARVLEHGQLDGAKRHLDAAMELLTPRNLYRHGITDDEGHVLAKHHMHQVHRHRLTVQDIEDTAGRNDRLRTAARAAREPDLGNGDTAVAATAARPVSVVDLAAWQSERRDPSGRWMAGAYSEILSHPQLQAMDARDRAVIESHVKRARSASDHTTAELHLTDAVRRATGAGAGSLTTAITRVRNYHRRAATAGLGIKPMMSQAAYNRKIKAEQARPRPAARLVPGRRYVPFELATELSARTAMLERTPAPRGRPGGPGLYHVKGMGHTPYLQQVVKALIEKRGMPPDKAYAIARAAIRRWMARSKHPEVKSAAARAEVGEEARQARAHAHTADPWAVADLLVELSVSPGQRVVELFNPYHAPTGQFTTASGAGQGQGKQQGGRAAQRKQLMKRAASLRSQIRTLEGQLRTARSRPSSRRSQTATPAKKGAAATSARQAAQGKATATKPGTGHRAATASPATIRAKIIALRGELQQTLAQLRALR